MASAAERNTVWVGFMDTVPVIGTVKEMVEWVLALYEGNKVVLLEKEKAILQLVREPLYERMKRLALTKKPKKAGAAASKSALLNIQEVKQDELLDFLSPAIKNQKEPAKVPEEEKPAKVLEEGKPSKVPEEEPVKVLEEKKPGKVLEEEKPSKVPEEEPVKVLEEEKPGKVLEEEKPSKVPEEEPVKVLEEEKPGKVLEEEKPSKVTEEEKPSKVTEEELAKVKKKTAKVPKKTAAKMFEKSERQKKLQKLKNDVLIKIHLVKPNYELGELLKEELRRSNRGEHVFNNDILKFYSKLLLLFTNNRIYNLCDNMKQQIAALGKHTLDSNTKKEIQTKMTVDFDEDEFYVNTNAILYGVYSDRLQNNFHHILQCRDRTVSCRLKTDLELIIDNMNNSEIYVDQFAKVKWINNNNKKKRFNTVKGKVVNMYKNERGRNWILNVMEQLKPLLREFRQEGIINHQCSPSGSCSLGQFSTF